MRRWLAGLALVIAGWLATPNAVPIYDGVGTPDEPYRYANASPAARPETVTRQVPTLPGATQVAAVRVQTSEQGPQLLLDLPAGQLTGITLPSNVTVTVEAREPDGLLPRGAFDGNAYRILTNPATRAVTNREGFVFLRAAVMTQPAPIIVHRAIPGGPWQELTTQRAGRDIVAANLAGLGDYAVARLPGSTPVKAAPRNRMLLIFLSVLTLMLVTITLVYLRNSSAERE